ncbi:MAG: hypothetical protein HY298_26730 [Verrucomicrobia bacterium]|nr:hypothetical protein [Verrucomicrobiota bacterium]
MSAKTVSLLLTLALIGCVTPQKKSGSPVTIQVDRRINKDAMPYWLGYLTARAGYIGKHKAEYVGETGVIVPHFEEEVDARTKAAQVYDELQSKVNAKPNSYFAELAKVNNAGFMREYVWTYLRQTAWTDNQEPSRLKAFETWAKENIPNHQPITYGKVTFQ